LAKVRVWDLPTRIFHWLLAACFAGLVATGEWGGSAMEWHFRLGYAVLTLLAFRLLWGFVGGHWSRFRHFVVSPRAAYAFCTQSVKTGPSVGHNPLGSWSVLALLGFLMLQAVAGLASDDEILATGPLASKVPAAWVRAATFFHTEVGKVVLIALVALHLAAIAWYRFRKQENLLAPMVHGDKELAGAVPASRDDIWTRLLAALLAGLCAAALALLLRWAA
jgi:cytochrome b